MYKERLEQVSGGDDGARDGEKDFIERNRFKNENEERKRRRD